MAKMLAFGILAIFLFLSFVCGLFGVMSARNNFQLLMISIIPTALVPASYFLLSHGLFAPDSERTYRGITAALAVAGVNFLVLIAWVWLISALVAIWPDLAYISESMYALLLLSFVAQLLTSLRLKRWLSLSAVRAGTGDAT